MAARKQTELAANEVMLGAAVVALKGALERTLAEHEALREAEIAWDVEQDKEADEQQLSVLFQLLIAMFGYDHADAINALTVIEALRTWAAATAAIQAADSALMAEFGVTVGESEAPTDSLTEFKGAIEYDLITLGLRLRDLGTERLTWGDLVRVTQHLPPESATVRAIVQHYRHSETEPDADPDTSQQDWDAREIDELKAILAAPRSGELSDPDAAPGAPLGVDPTSAEHGHGIPPLALG